jgi:hypothetical protein
MKKTFLGILFLGAIFLSLSFAIAAEITQLSKKASRLRLGMTRENVIRLLGKPKWAVIPNDKGEFALSDRRIKLELHWHNPGCNPVVVQFNDMLKVTGWDEGRAFCGKDARLFEPSDEYSCIKPDRDKFCK